MPPAENRYDFLYSGQITLAANATGQVHIRTQQDSSFVVQTMMADSTGRFHAVVADDGRSQNWMSNMVDQTLAFGTAQRPNGFLTPVILPPASMITVTVENLTAVGNTIEFSFGGYKAYGIDLTRELKAGGRRPDEWFQYDEVIDLAAGNRDSVSITLQANSYFEVHKLMARSSGPAPAYAAYNFEARVSDSSDGRSWSDRMIRFGDQFGNAQYPRVLPFPKLLKPNTVVTVDVHDLSALLTNSIEIVLEGAKRYEL